MWQNYDAYWQCRLSLLFVTVLEYSHAVLPAWFAASCCCTGGNHMVPCPIVHTGFQSKEQLENKPILEYSSQSPSVCKGQAQGCRALCSAFEMLSDCGSWSQGCWAHSRAFAPCRIGAYLAVCPYDLWNSSQVVKWNTMNYRSKNKAAEDIFNAFGCNHISQVIVQFLCPFSSNPSLNCFSTLHALITSVAFSLVYCHIYLHQPWAVWHLWC